MTDKLKLYDLPPSPNNMKAQIALAYKELPYEKVLVDFQDRSEVVKISGQPLTPVLVHGDRVIFDSGAILRYLDANFRSSRPLYSTNREAMQAIEQWELYSRTDTVKPVSMVFSQAFAEKKDPAVLAQASEVLTQVTARFEETLAKGSWLVGNELTAADVFNAPWVYYGMLTDEDGKASDIHKLFQTTLNLGAGRDKTRDWVKRVMAYNR